MATSTRIKGTGLSLTIGSTDYWADAISTVLENEESDESQTFYDTSLGGGRRFYFTISAVQSTEAGSFWSYVWANTGEIVSYVYAPHGNATPTADQPHFEGTVKIPAKPSIGGEASMTGNYTFEVRMDCQEEPTKVTA